MNNKTDKHDPVSGFESMVKQVYKDAGPSWDWDALVSVVNIKKIKGEKYWNDFFEQMCKDNPKTSISKPKERWMPLSTKKRLNIVETQTSFDENLERLDDVTTEESAKNKMIELREKISYHNDIYYNHPDRVELSDFEFDMMLKDLEHLEFKYPQFRTVDSPTQQVGN